MAFSLIVGGKDICVSLNETIDLSSTAQLKEEFERVMSSDITVVRVNASGLDYIDSSGVASLLFMRKLCTRFNATLIFESISPAAARVIRLANLDAMLGLPKAISAATPVSSLSVSGRGAVVQEPKFSDADALAIFQSNSPSVPNVTPDDAGSFAIKPPSFF